MTRIGFLAMLLLSTPLAADPSEGLAVCTTIASADERLNCYDELARDSGLQVARELRPGPHWLVVPDSLPGGDDESVLVTLAAHGKLEGDAIARKPRLYLRCRGGSIEAWVHTRIPAKEERDTESKSVQIKLDDGDHFTVRMRPFDDGQSLQFPSATRLVYWLLSHERMTFQLNPLNAVPSSVWFDVIDLDRALEPVMELCGLETLDPREVEGMGPKKLEGAQTPPDAIGGPR